MFAELPHEKFHLVIPLFATLTFNTEVPSILDGNTRGRIFVDDPDNPAVALIWDGLIGLFLAGTPNRAGFNRGLQGWFAAEPIPQAQAHGMQELALTYTPNAWAAQLPQLLRDHKLTQELRCFHTHAGTPAACPELDAAYTVLPVTAELLGHEDLKGRDWLRGWILPYWPTIEMYFDKGIGYVALVDDEAVASLCVSVFASGDALEFGTETHPVHRNHGLSTAVAAACVNSCLTRGSAPIWHCWDTNAPSIAVARKVGFHLEGKYTVYKLWIPASAN
ncbi:MAG: GNAT family N-acetyltransferase [Anaerolineae bacterium]|nr:GNAT family N-acetyltransferase [Anaerolineae bacterium]